MDSLLNFDVPMRRKLPIRQPSIWRSRGFRVIQSRQDLSTPNKAVRLPSNNHAAVIETGCVFALSRHLNATCIGAVSLAWTDLESKKPLDLDWNGQGRSGSIPVMRLDEFIGNYARHPEAKAAGPDGKPRGAGDPGRSGASAPDRRPPRRIGKEVDRLDEDEDFTLR